MAQNDLYKLRMVARDTTFGQEVQNIFWYKQVSVTGNAESLAKGWYEDVLPDIQAIVHSHIDFDLAEAINVDTPTDFYNQLMGATYGGRTGAELPPWFCHGYRLARSSRESRHGYKRFAGVVEEDVSGVTYAAGIAAAVAALGVQLKTNIVYSIDSAEFEPRIVRVTRVNPGVVPAVYTYQDWAIADATWYGWTTQNTRKR